MEKLSVSIKIELLKQGKSQADISRDLNISQAAVSQFVSGKERSKRFDEWVRTNLGLDMTVLRNRRR